jgi:hypothetical protein
MCLIDGNASNDVDNSSGGEVATNQPRMEAYLENEANIPVVITLIVRCRRS